MRLVAFSFGAIALLFAAALPAGAFASSVNLPTIAQTTPTTSVIPWSGDYCQIEYPPCPDNEWGFIVAVCGLPVGACIYVGTLP